MQKIRAVPTFLVYKGGAGSAQGVTWASENMEMIQGGNIIAIENAVKNALSE